MQKLSSLFLASGVCPVRSFFKRTGKRVRHGADFAESTSGAGVGPSEVQLPTAMEVAKSCDGHSLHEQNLQERTGKHSYMPLGTRVEELSEQERCERAWKVQQALKEKVGRNHA